MAALGCCDLDYLVDNLRSGVAAHTTVGFGVAIGLGIDKLVGLGKTVRCDLDGHISCTISQKDVVQTL